MAKNIEKEDMTEKEIIRTWLAGHSSCTLVIPKEFARQYGLDKHNFDRKLNAIWYEIIHMKICF